MREQADAGMMELANAQYTGQQDVNSDRLHVTFDLWPVKNEAKSLEVGRDVYDDVEYVRIMVPGDKHLEVHRPATQKDIRRFPRQYAAFKAGAAQALTGTPLSDWPAITRAQVAELKYFNVHTVEQLAQVSDGNLMNMGTYRALQAKALDFMAKAAGNAPMEKMRAELASRDSEMEALRRQVKELSESLSKNGNAKTK